MPPDLLAPSEQLLQQPAAAAARAVALELLDRAAHARRRIGPFAEPDAVHDFRVALRRLRSWEQTFRPQLKDVIPHKLRRRLKKLAQASNPSRDATVHLQWLRDQLATLTPGEQTGAQWFIESLEHQKGVADAQLLRSVDTQFAMIRRRLMRALHGPMKRGAKRRKPNLSLVAAQSISGQVKALRESLASVHSVADYKEAHAARIAGKRLRYTLEPLATYVQDIPLILDHLKRLQDVAGELHDTHTFMDELIAAVQRAAANHAKRVATAVFKGDLSGMARVQQENPMPGILTLAARLREREADCFETLSREWLNGAAEDLLNKVHGVADVLRVSGASCRPLH